MRIDHRALVHIRADVDVHRGHARDALRDVSAAPDARSARHDTDAAVLAKHAHGIRMLVTKRQRADGHIDDPADTEAEQDALLDPGVHAPAGWPGWVGLGGADAPTFERGAEFIKEVE